MCKILGMSSTNYLTAKGLTFRLPPKYLDQPDYLVNFELVYRNICNLGIFL